MKNKIRVFRAMYMLTQEDLARAIGVNRQTILAIEKEKYVPSLDLAFRISRYFGVNIEEVFLFDEKIPRVVSPEGAGPEEGESARPPPGPGIRD